MTTIPDHVLVIGAGLGGLRTIEALRQEGFAGHITLVGAEPHLPYDRPPLSKQFLAGDWTEDQTQLVDRDRLAELHVDLALGNRVVELRDMRAVLADGTRIDADAVVVATGVRAREIPGQTRGFATLRSLDDARDLRIRLDRAASVLVLGSGFIGTEIASTAIKQGKSVTIVEAAAHPFARSLGATIGQMTMRVLADNDVHLLCNTVVDEFLEVSDGVSVRLSDGTTRSADLGVVGIGGVPDIDWLADDRLVIDNGLRCGANGLAVGTDNVWALGDAASWFEEGLNTHIRTEHWTSTQDQAKIVAASILGRPGQTLPISYVWSDQFGMKIQILGRATPTDEVVALHGQGLDGGTVRGTVFGHYDGDKLVAVTGFGAPAIVARYRAAILSGFDRAQTEAFAQKIPAPKMPVAQ